MSWYNTEGTSPQFYVFSEAQYLRSPANLPFHTREGEQYDKLLGEIDALMIQNGFQKEIIPSVPSARGLSLVEKQFVSRDDTSCERILYLNEPCNLAITVGGRHFFTIRAILAGHAIEESCNVAAGAEEMLDAAFESAYSDELGYLFADPSECGTGATLSAALYLPSLAYATSFERLRRDCSRAGAELTPLSAHRGNPGDLYRLSAAVPREIGERGCVGRLETLTEKIVKNEEATLRAIYGEKPARIADRACRAYGILSYAKEISEPEFLTLLSQMRLGLIFAPEAMPPFDHLTLNALLADGLCGSVAANAIPLCVTEEEALGARARFTADVLKTARGEK